MPLARSGAWCRAHPLLVDGGLSFVAIFFFVVPEALSHDRIGWNTFFGAASLAALAWRRSRPDASGVAVAVICFAAIAAAAEIPAPGAMLAGPLGCYSMAAYGSRIGAWAALGLGMAGGAAVAVSQGAATADRAVSAVVVVGFFAGAWALGMLRRSQRAEAAAVADRAAAAERTRIAREMHDIIAHSLTVVIAQADGGRYAARADPARAVAALEAISGTARQALGDVRSLLGVLRDEGGGDGSYAALPGVVDVPQLVESARAHGLDVRFAVDGEPVEPPPGIGLAAYRIVQESLTNVLRHAGAGVRVDCVVRWRDDELAVSVVDSGGRGRHDDVGAGRGLLGMRERAALFGGTVDAGRRADGFAVHARLPLERAA